MRACASAMVTDAEAPTMIDVMSRAYGAPSERNTDYVTFARPRGLALSTGGNRCLGELDADVGLSPAAEPIGRS